MSIGHLLTIPVLLVTRDFSTTDEDEQGNPIPTETTREAMGFVSRQSRNEVGGQGTLTETYTLFLDADEPIDGWDAVEVWGQRYEVIGPPAPEVRALTGRVHHIEATIRVSDPERVAV